MRILKKRGHTYDNGHIDYIILRPQSFRGNGVVMLKYDIMNKIGKVNGIQINLPIHGTGVNYEVFVPDTSVRSKNSVPNMKIGNEDKARFVEIIGRKKEKKLEEKVGRKEQNKKMDREYFSVLRQIALQFFVMRLI